MHSPDHMRRHSHRKDGRATAEATKDAAHSPRSSPERNGPPRVSTPSFTLEPTEPVPMIMPSSGLETAAATTACTLTSVYLGSAFAEPAPAAWKQRPTP